MINVVRVRANPEGRLRLVFSDGTKGEADLSQMIRSFPPFKSLSDPKIFMTAHVEEGSVAWDNGLDIAVEQLYALAHHLPQPQTFEQAQNNELHVSLNELRKMENINQEQLAEALKVTQGAVSKMENTRADSKLSTVRDYLRAMGWDLELVAVKGDKRVRLRGI